MASEWFYTRDGKSKAGPVASAQLKALARSGQLLPTDMVWKEGMAQWKPQDDDESAINLGQRRSMTPSPDHHREVRTAVSTVMEELAQFYVLVLPAVKRSTAEEAEAIIAQFFLLHDALGRLKIAMLPKGL